MFFFATALLLFCHFEVLDSYQTRFKRDFMFITDGNTTDAGCFEDCQQTYKSKFEYTFNQSLSDFYDFPFHPVMLDSSSFQLYCTLSNQKTKCFSEKCSDYTADHSFSPSNFVCFFKKSLFEKAMKCLSKTEPITFLKCDHECHEEIVRTDKITVGQSSNQVFISSELKSYETELNKLCRFQDCYVNCMEPIVKEMCGSEEAQHSIDIIKNYVQWHADDISDWHTITGNEESLPKSCQKLAKTRSKTDDPILQLINENS